jgi:catechol 2,3-dioxygenase-like lactoylglutathione lyase family enzyme
MAKSKPKIRHLALFAQDPKKLADFYVKVFDMKIIRHTTAAYFVSDGYLTLALLPFRIEGATPTVGLNHFGFQCEDADEISKRIVEYGLRGPTKRPADRPYAEVRAADPEGNMFDLSQRGFEEQGAGEREMQTANDSR